MEMSKERESSEKHPGLWHLGITLWYVLEDTVLIAALLISITSVHFVLERSHVSDGGKGMFSRTHEMVFYATYLLLAGKTMLRIFRHNFP